MNMEDDNADETIADELPRPMSIFFNKNRHSIKRPVI